MGVASVVTAVAGALIADVAPERVLRIGFAILLVATAIQLMLRTRRGVPGRLTVARAAPGGSLS